MWYSYLIFYSCHSHCRNAESQYAPLYIISLRNDEKQVPRSSGTTMTRWMFCTRITRRLVVLLLDWVLLTPFYHTDSRSGSTAVLYNPRQIHYRFDYKLFSLLGRSRYSQANLSLTTAVAIWTPWLRRPVVSLWAGLVLVWSWCSWAFLLGRWLGRPMVR
jgi:hypothetical protein